MHLQAHNVKQDLGEWTKGVKFLPSPVNKQTKTKVNWEVLFFQVPGAPSRH